MEKTIPERLAELKSELEITLDSKAKSALEAEMKTLKGQLDSIEAIKTENATLKSSVEKLQADAVANQKALDEIVAERKQIKNSPVRQGMYGEFAAKMAESKDMLADIKNGKGKKFGFELESTKAVGIMASATNFTGTYFTAPQVVPGVVATPYEEVHLRNLLPVGSTDSNLIRYVRDLGGEGGPAMTAEGGTKPQMDRDFSIIDSPVKKIATYIRVPEEMFDDNAFLQSFLVAIGLEELFVVEDAQILYGAGTGSNLSGLFTNATAFAAGTSVVATPNNFDVLLAAEKQLRVAKLGGPLVGLMNPVDYYAMRTKKDTTGNYLFLGGGNGIALSNPAGAATGINLGGIRVDQHTAIAEGDFLVFQPKSAMIFDRTGTMVRFYDQDQDNAIKNLITIVIEKRLALAIFRPAGFVKGTFATAITDLTS